jgi:CheY-like chemotaxis protein
LYSVLIVEDDPTFLALEKELLDPDRFSVFSAENGTEALKAVKDCDFDVIILDKKLPDISGDDLCKIIRFEIGNLTVPIVMVTGEVSTKSLIQSFNNGATDFIKKPFDLTEFSIRIEAAAQRRFFLQNAANYETRTSLPNKFILSDRLRHALFRHKRINKMLGVLVFEWKSWELEIIDQAISTIRSRIRTSDTIAVINPYTVFILLESLSRVDDLEKVHSDIKYMINSELTSQKNKSLTDFYSGFALSPDNGDTVDKLLNHARKSWEDSLTSY